MSQPNVFPEILIRHNHGTCKLQNARLDGDYLVGTCIGGGETARLFHATSHTAYPTGVERREYIGGRKPCLMYGEQWVVDTTFC